MQDLRKWTWFFLFCMLPITSVRTRRNLIISSLCKSITFDFDMRIYLVGFMGSGKTTLGRAVAKHYQVPFFGTDEEIEKHEEMSVYDIFTDKGEFYFREL